MLVLVVLVKYKIETPSGSGITIDVKIHDIPVSLPVVVPFEFDIYGFTAKIQEGSWDLIRLTTKSYPFLALPNSTVLNVLFNSIKLGFPGKSLFCFIHRSKI